MHKWHERAFFFSIMIVFLSGLLSGCAAPANPEPDRSSETTVPSLPPASLTVMAAASLNGPFSELGKQFEARHPGVTVTFNFAGSQQLAQQLNEDAPADVFASANKKQMDVVVQTGRVRPDDVDLFTQNKLVVIYPKNNPTYVESLAGLAKDRLKVILAAAEVPVGQYSLDFLDKAVASGNFDADFKERVLANVVSYENNVKLVLTKVALGEADAGIVYSSDVFGAEAKKVGQIAIPDGLNVIASYPIAVIDNSKSKDAAQAFVDFVQSEEGRVVLANFGFIPIE